MKNLEKAIKFAIKAHAGQPRKLNPELPMIIHPVGVAHILREYNMDEAVIAAGYLHDVVEDTKYTIEDIEDEFGEDIADLVKSATEIDKLLSWEERKEETINRTRQLPFRNKALICADKIHNIESLYYDFHIRGEEDWKPFKRGRDKQEWYYRSVYKSLIYNEDEDRPIFQRLNKAINALFGKNNNKTLIKNK